MESKGLWRIAQFLHIYQREKVICNENKALSGG
jgi:hypothetical protein